MASGDVMRNTACRLLLGVTALIFFAGCGTEGDVGPAAGGGTTMTLQIVLTGTETTQNRLLGLNVKLTVPDGVVINSSEYNGFNPLSGVFTGSEIAHASTLGQRAVSIASVLTREPRHGPIATIYCYLAPGTNITLEDFFLEQDVVDASGSVSGLNVVLSDVNGTTVTGVPFTTALSLPVVTGDLNGDRRFSIADIVRATQVAFGMAIETAADLEQGDVAPSEPDGHVNLADVVVLLRRLVDADTPQIPTAVPVD